MRRQCTRIRQDLTAWVDGELAGRRRARLDDHLDQCPDCRVEAELLRHSVVAQTMALRALAPPDANLPLLWTRLSGAMAGEPRSLWRFGRAFAGFGLAAVAALLVGVRQAGGPEVLLVPIGVKSPPPKVKTKPRLFQEYPLIEKLEILENLDTVDAIQLDEESPSDAG